MAGDFLDRILEKKREEVEASMKAVSERELAARVRKERERRPFFERLSTVPMGRQANVIAEIKRASPSKGPLHLDMDAPAQARAYEAGGAAAISVLTDRSFFQARPGDLEAVRASVHLPVLRKDFLISTYQVYESAVMGSDAVLLIVRALSPALLETCLSLSSDLGLDALVEVRSEGELDTAVRAGARLIGINNRDLGTFRTDIETSIDLARRLPPGRIAVSESGIHGREQVERLLASGIRNFLIGESLVKAPEPASFLKQLIEIAPQGNPLDSSPSPQSPSPSEGRGGKAGLLPLGSAASREGFTEGNDPDSPLEGGRGVFSPGIQPFSPIGKACRVGGAQRNPPSNQDKTSRQGQQACRVRGAQRNPLCPTTGQQIIPPPCMVGTVKLCPPYGTPSEGKEDKAEPSPVTPTTSTRGGRP